MDVLAPLIQEAACKGKDISTTGISRVITLLPETCPSSSHVSLLGAANATDGQEQDPTSQHQASPRAHPLLLHPPGHAMAQEKMRIK